SSDSRRTQPRSRPPGARTSTPMHAPEGCGRNRGCSSPRVGTARRMKILYQPFGLLVSVIGGIFAGALFKRVWRAVAHEDSAPKAKDRDRTWREVIAAAAIQGAVFGGVKALTDRAGAAGFAHLTGVWPGKTKSPHS